MTFLTVDELRALPDVPDWVEVPAHITIDPNINTGRVVKKYGVNYIVAPTERVAAHLWLGLLEQEMSK